MPLEWTREPVRFFQHLLRETDAKGLQVADLVTEMQGVGAGACIVMGGGFSAWYPTRLGTQTINPHLDFDFVGEMLAAAKKADIRVVIRMDISKGRAGAEQQQPDWFVKREDHSASTVWAMPQVCATGPIWQEQTFSILDEMLTLYPALDGFFFNYLHVPRCHCERCRAIVREATGSSVPVGGVRSPLYERWRQEFLADYMGRVRAFIQARNPGAALIPYHHVHDGWNLRRMAEVSDIIGSQVSNPVIPNPVDPQPAWNFWAAEEALTARALKPQSAPILIQTTSEVFASRQSAMPDARLVHNLVQAAAHGANTAPAVNGRIAGDDPRFAGALTAFGQHQKRAAKWYSGLRSVARIALVKSEESRLWGKDEGRAAGVATCDGHVAEFRGFFELASDLRYPIDLVVSGALSEASLERYDVVLLPAVECLSHTDAAAIDRFVAQGGQVIASADLANSGETGQPHSVPVLDCLPAHPGKAISAVGGYLELRAERWKEPFGNLPHIAVTGDFWEPPIESGADADLCLIGPFSNNAPEFTVVEGPGTAPGLIAVAYGKGRAIWFPWRIGALYHRYSMPEYRDVFRAILEAAAGPAPMRTMASSAVELVLYDHPDGQVLHVLNGAAARTKELTELTPLAGFDISVETDAQRAILLGCDSAIRTTRSGSHLVLSIERLDGFAAIALPRREANGNAS